MFLLLCETLGAVIFSGTFMRPTYLSFEVQLSERTCSVKTSLCPQSSEFQEWLRILEHRCRCCPHSLRRPVFFGAVFSQVFAWTTFVTKVGFTDQNGWTPIKAVFWHTIWTHFCGVFFEIGAGSGCCFTVHSFYAMPKGCFFYRQSCAAGSTDVSEQLSQTKSEIDYDICRVNIIHTSIERTGHWEVFSLCL